jgi:hypothetical protein
MTSPWAKKGYEEGQGQGQEEGKTDHDQGSLPAQGKSHGQAEEDITHTQALLTAEQAAGQSQQ